MFELKYESSKTHIGNSLFFVLPANIRPADWAIGVITAGRARQQALGNRARQS